MDDLEQDFPDLQSIAQHFPVHPAFSIDMMNPDLWIAAIKKQKAGSARGIAVSSQEFRLLPRGFVATLAHTRAQYPRGVFVWFMTALPCPLSKHDDLPDGSSARPIATSQMSKCLLTGGTGLLPSRGASDCAYSAQFELELAAKVRNRCSGIVMDLKQCFNNIRWICGLYFPQRNWSAH